MAMGRKTQRYWTVQELEVLDREYPHRTAQELHSLFFPYRSPDSIRHKLGHRVHEKQLQKEGRRWVRFNKPSRLKEMSDIWKGYLAGMIDGEGNMRLGKDQKDGLHPRIVVANTHRDAVQKLREITGIGGVYIRENRGTNWKPVWSWNVNGIVDTEAVLVQVKDYLIVKRRQAELLLKFTEIYRSRPSYGEVTPQIREIDEELRKLNKRGPLASP